MRIAQERGVILIQVALVSFVMLGLAAFSIDYGAAWYARSQAQTAADAGALAGATALGADDRTWPFSPTGIVVQSATATANLNPIYGSAGSLQVLAECPPFAPWNAAPNDTHCVRVNVYRDGSNSSGTLPTYFANVFGVGSQGVKATATAKVIAANASGCMRPWFIPDDWVDTDMDNIVDPGEYTVGYELPQDIGRSVTFHPKQGPSAYGQLMLTPSGTSEQVDSILHCTDDETFYVGQTNVPTEPGAHNGQKNAVIDLVDNIDPGATYDSSTNTITGSCAETLSCNCSVGGSPGPCPYGGLQSPRIVQAAVCDPTDMDCAGERTPPGGPGFIDIIKILSFFITDYTWTAGELHIHAVLIGSGGDIDPRGTTGSPANTTLYAVRLIR